jgi:type IX secretion system substrate protein
LGLQPPFSLNPTIMKRTIYILCLLVCTMTALHRAYGQQYDRHWLGRIIDQHRGVFMRFGEDSISYLVAPPDASVMEIVRGSLAMSNAEGELQFYTNGNVVLSWDHHIMQGGKGFNQGATNDDFLSKWGGGDPDTTWNIRYNPYTYQIIPDAYDENIYYMIHSFVIETGDWCNILYSPKMQISKVDMSANGGKGKVVYKNHYFDQKLVDAAFALVRHGNGKDWWVVLRRHDGTGYRSVLLQRDSVVQAVESDIPELGTDWLTCADWYSIHGNLLDASMDGSRLLDNYGRSAAKLLAFDRCSGEVSLLDTFSTGITPLETVGGVVINCTVNGFQFSPSGRYLYGAGCAEFAQWDLEAADIGASKVKLGGVPWALDDEQNVKVGYRGGFKAFAPGPDGKIYNLMRTAHSVIEYPDEPGEASGLCLAADNAPGSCLGPNVPYYLFSNRFPNYRLGALAGSACDTIRQDTVPPPPPIPVPGDYGVKVWPNPASGQVSIEVTLPEYESGTAAIEVVDMLGRVLHRHHFPKFAYLYQMDVSDWASGVYNIVLRHEGRLQATGRLVVAR